MCMQARLYTHALAFPMSSGRAQVEANTKDTRGHTPLHYACYHGSDPCVSALLDEEVDYTAEGEHPFGPLHCAA